MEDIRQRIEQTLTEIRTAVDNREISMETVEQLFLEMLEN